MKKLAIAAVAIAVIGAAGWSALWFVGRGAVEARLDAEIENFQAQGYRIEHGAREIAGFPFGYEITYRDVAVNLPGVADVPGGAYRLPWITAEVTAADVDRVVARLPEKFQLEVPVAPAARERDPSLPERYLVEFEAEDLTAMLDGLLQTDRELTLNARSVMAVSAGPSQQSDVAVEFKGMEMGGTLPPPESNRPTNSRVLVDRIEYAIAIAGAGASDPQLTLEGAIDALRMTGTSDIHGANAFMNAITEGQGITSIAYQSGPTRNAMKVPEGAGNWAGSLTFDTGSTAGTMAIENGVVKLDAAGQANRFAMTNGAGPALGGQMRALEVGYAIPVAPTEHMTPMLFRLALDQVTLDDALWALFDAGSVLPREPARLVIDVEASARMTRRLDQLRPGEGPPLELGNATIRAADLTALGAKVTTRGDVEFLQPIQMPVGKITVTLHNVFELVNKLSEAGLLTPDMAQMAIAMGSGFTIAGATPGERTSVVELTPGGIMVNGIPVSR